MRSYNIKNNSLNDLFNKNFFFFGKGRGGGGEGVKLVKMRFLWRLTNFLFSLQKIFANIENSL